MHPNRIKNLPPPPDPEKRFWATMVKGEGCWEWTGKRFANGYGCFFITEDGKCRYKLAHRQAWAFTYGAIPEGLLVLHHCDNPPCCHPMHLFLGTTQDNIADKMRKGHASGPRGEASAKARFTEEDIRNIRRLNREGMGKRKLAALYGCATNTIYCIIRERTWTHVIE